MTTIIEIGTTNYDECILPIKIVLSHIQTNCEITDGYSISEPTSKFGWTFFQLLLKSSFHDSIEKNFSDMIQKYKGKKEEKLIKFLSDFFELRGSKVKLKLIEYY